jgi:hypothetical protein
MEKTRAEIFRERQPAIADQDVVEAARTDQVVASFNAMPVIVEGEHVSALAVKVVLTSGEVRTFLMDRHVAIVLGGLFDLLNQGDWRGTQLPPPDVKLS